MNLPIIFFGNVFSITIKLLHLKKIPEWHTSFNPSSKIVDHNKREKKIFTRSCAAQSVLLISLRSRWHLNYHYFYLTLSFEKKTTSLIKEHIYISTSWEFTSAHPNGYRTNYSNVASSLRSGRGQTNVTRSNIKPAYQKIH